MKQPKKPKLAEKKVIKTAGLNWRNWAVIDNEEDSLIIYNKLTKKIRKIKK